MLPQRSALREISPAVNDCRISTKEYPIAAKALRTEISARTLIVAQTNAGGRVPDSGRSQRVAQKISGVSSAAATSEGTTTSCPIEGTKYSSGASSSGRKYADAYNRARPSALGPVTADRAFTTPAGRGCA